jgi:hypothetical protein
MEYPGTTVTETQAPAQTPVRMLNIKGFRVLELPRGVESPSLDSFVNGLGAGPGNDVCAYMQDINYTPKSNVRGLEAPYACNTGNRNRQTQYL